MPSPSIPDVKSPVNPRINNAAKLPLRRPLRPPPRPRPLPQHIPPIHETFRRRGYPIERAGKVHQVTFTPSGSTPVQLTEQQHWDYRNKDETWSILLTHDTVILQTTAYSRFEDFAERLRMAVHTVLAESEHDRLGVVHRVGLRYIDVVRASGGRDFRFYLRPGLHGVPDEVFQPGQHLLHTECRGRTVVGETPGTMVVRIVQNDQGSPLPPDLVDAPPSFSPRAEAGELVTLIDMDHFVEGNFDADPDWVVARACEMHDHIIETFHGQGLDPLLQVLGPKPEERGDPLLHDRSQQAQDGVGCRGG